MVQVRARAWALVVGSLNNKTQGQGVSRQPNTRQTGNGLSE